MRLLKLFLWLGLWMITTFNLSLASELYVLSEKELPLPFKNINQEKLCEYPQIIIYGINAYLKVKDKPCPNQLRIITGILYLSRVYHPSNVHISPLPHPKTLRPLGEEFTVIYSNQLGFYVEELKRHYQITPYKLKTPYDLEKILPIILKEKRKILLLPDDQLLDERAFYILKYWLKRHASAIVIDFIGLDLECPNKITISQSRKKYLEEVFRYVKTGGLERGKIYYVVY